MTINIDAKGLKCPEPIMLLHKAIRDSNSGDLIHLTATDKSTKRDVDKFCESEPWTRHLMAPESVLLEKKSCLLSKKQVQSMWTGQCAFIEEQDSPLTKGEIICYDESRNLVAVGTIENQLVTPKRCFIG